MAIMFILIRLIATFFVYNDAKKRGHGAMSAILWSVGSGVVPLVIVPLYFLLGRKAKVQDQSYDNDVIDIEATVVEDIITCTKCEREIKEGSLVCPYCQAPTGASDNNN